MVKKRIHHLVAMIIPEGEGDHRDDGVGEDDTGDGGGDEDTPIPITPMLITQRVPWRNQLLRFIWNSVFHSHPEQI